MDVDLRLVLQFDSNREALVRDFLPCPPPLGEDYEVVIIAVVFDVSRHFERRSLERACTANIAAMGSKRTWRYWKIVKPHFIFPAMTEVLEDVIRVHPSDG